MYTALTYSYLLLPLGFLLFHAKNWKIRDVTLIAIYGLIAFLFLFFDIDSVPIDYKKLYAFTYTSTEYFFFTFFLWLNISNKKAKWLIIVLSVSFYLFQGFYFLYAKIGRIDSIPVGVETIFLFIYIFIYFFENFKTPKAAYIYNHYCFWIAVGILIYLGGAFFFYILANHVDPKELDPYWDLTYIAEIVKNIFFFVALLVFQPNSKSNKIQQVSNMPFLDIT